MTTKEFDKKLEHLIEQKFLEFFGDPDYGLGLTEETKRRLRAAQNKKQKTFSLSEVRKKYY